jgi:glutaconate CoA-transferase subunit A
MRRPERLSIEEAVARIPADATVSFGGFDIMRAPMALVFELARRPAGRLELVSPPNPLAVDVLIGAGIVEKATLAFSGFQFTRGFAVGPMWKDAVENRKLDYREVDAYAILSGFRAAAMGLPFLPMTDMDGSELADPERWSRVLDPFNGRTVTVTRPIQPDVVLVHAQAADEKGNLFIEDPIIDELVVKAGRTVIASTEKIVPRIERPTVPFYLVGSLAEAPRGAWPTACKGYYPADHDHIDAYITEAADGCFEEYRKRFIDKDP